MLLINFKHSSRGMSLITGLALVVSMTGCGSAEQDNHETVQSSDVFLTKEEMREEMETAAASLLLPTDFVWPQHALERFPEDSEFEPRYGEGIAHEIAMCAWEREAFENRESAPDISDAALDEYEKLTLSEIVDSNYEPEAAETVRRFPGQARLGDWTQLQYEVEVVCEFYLSNDTSTETKVDELFAKKSE